MKQVRWLIFILLAIMAAGVFMLARRSFSSNERYLLPENGASNFIGMAATSVPVPPLETKRMPEVPAPSTAAPSGGAIFDSPTARDGFQASMKRITGALSASQSQEWFAALGVDTEVNKTRALQLSMTAYSPGREREEVRQKVLAQYFLKYSARFGNKECLDALSANMALVRSNAAAKELERIYALDVLVLAKICARKDFASVDLLAQKEDNSLVRAQLLAALESINEEKQSPTL
ncbi:MAG: hypothetical protein JNM83_16815 [Myxococcales bacterium]|nr:hypothetical protein [Myxococcales bacterium]